MPLYPTSTNNTVSTATATATPSSVAVTTTSTVVLAADANRKKFSIFNSGNTTALIELGATPTSAAYFMPISPGYLYVDDIDWRGTVNAITASGTSTLLVRSFS